MKSLDEVKDIKRRVKKDLINKPGVSGVGVGFKEESGKATEKPAIRVYVNLKKKHFDIPKDELIPSEIDGALTDVIEDDQEGISYSNPRRIGAQRSGGALVGGAGIGPSRTFGNNKPNSGTIGMIIGGQNEPKILSSFHVLAVDNNYVNEGNDLISQPAGTRNIVAVLEEAILAGNVDAAVARITDENRQRVNPGILDIGQVSGTVSRDEVVQMMQSQNNRVRKRGNVTQLRSGIITDFDWEGSIQYAYSPVHRFENQFQISPLPGAPEFSLPGDSGASVVDTSNRVIGLLVGGVGRKYSVANYIEDVQAYLGITI
jgi:hypothetical protein